MDRGSYLCRMRWPNHPKEKEMQECKVDTWRDLTDNWEKKRREGKRERERCTQPNAEFERTGRREKKALLTEQYKEIGKKFITRGKENWRCHENISSKDGTTKDRNSKALAAVEEIKRRCKNREEVYQKDLNDPDDHDGVITHLEPDILEWEVKCALGSITMNKANGVM